MKDKILTGYPSIDKPWLKYYSEEAGNAKLPECAPYEYLWENNIDHLEDIALNYFGMKMTYMGVFEEKVLQAAEKAGVNKVIMYSQSDYMPTSVKAEFLWEMKGQNRGFSKQDRVYNGNTL